MTDSKNEGRIQRLLDQSEIFDLVRVERFYRDQRNWKGLIESYVKNAPVRTTWFDGTIEGFAEASRRKMEEQGSTAKHWIFPTMLKIVDKRATIESPAMIFDRITFDNIQFDVFQYCRFFSRVVQTDAGWRLASFEGITSGTVSRRSIRPTRCRSTGSCSRHCGLRIAFSPIPRCAAATRSTQS